MTCDICNGTGWKTVEIDGIERVTRCDCWRQSIVERLYNDARIPPRYARCDLANFEHDMDSQRQAWRKAQAFVEAFPAVDILKEVVRTKGGRGYFFETRELLRMVRDTYNASVDETEMDILKPVLEADILI